MVRKNNLVTKPVLKQELKKIEKKLTVRMDGFDRHMRDFRTELSAHKIAIELKLEDHQEKTKTLITGFKDEILKAVDSVMKELEIMREENIITTDMKRQLNDHEDRLEIVEVKVGISPLAA